MAGAVSCSTEEEACGSVGSCPKKCVRCASTQNEPGCKEPNNLTGKQAPMASKLTLEKMNILHQKSMRVKGSEIGCSALHLPITGHTGTTSKDKIVPLEGKPYFTAVMGETSVCRQFLVKIPKNFHQFLPPSSARIALCCREKEWIAKCTVYPSVKLIREGWKQFVVDNNLKIGDGCVFELMNTHELKFRVQILSGELPATKTARFTDGNNIDTPILID